MNALCRKLRQSFPGVRPKDPEEQTTTVGATKEEEEIPQPDPEVRMEYSCWSLVFVM